MNTSKCIGIASILLSSIFVVLFATLRTFSPAHAAGINLLGPEEWLFTVGESSILKLQDDGNQVNGHSVGGGIGDTWSSIGGESSPLGLPISDEIDTSDGRGRYQEFQGGRIYWSWNAGAATVVPNHSGACAPSAGNVGASCAELSQALNGVPEGYRRKVAVGGRIKITDDEAWPWKDEHGELPVNHQLSINREFPLPRLVDDEKCVGGEVRVEVELDAAASNNDEVIIEGSVKLYEGTSCNTSDLADTKEVSFILPPNDPTPYKTVLRNSETFGGDTAKVSLNFTNCSEEAESCG